MNEKAIELCKALYDVLEPKGIYPALTGGTLYKEGTRKDIDIVLFKNRQKMPDFTVTDLIPEFNKIGVKIVQDYGFCTKALWEGEEIDFLFPETKSDGQYDQGHGHDDDRRDDRPII